MEEFTDYNFLIIGRSGAGKSATTKFLTGDPSIQVANSINQVTKEVKFYRAISYTFNHEHIRFGILDIPGLDKVMNRFQLRQKILEYLQQYQLSLHGIIYVASLTERDSINQHKLFQFLDQLPWNNDAKKSSLIPLLTKYDNFMMDSPQEDIAKTKQQFAKIFNENGYGSSWEKRVYWVNHTKSLEFKLQAHEKIRHKYQNQIQRLIEMAKNNTIALTAQLIKEQVQIQHQYVIHQLMKKIDLSSIPYVLENKSHRLCLTIKIEPNKLFESMSASSIGIVISRAIKNQIPTSLSILLLSVPLSLTILCLTQKNSFISSQSNECSFNYKVMNDFNTICNSINQQMKEEWNSLNQQLQFFIEKKQLYCKIPKHIKRRFFILDEVRVFEVMKETWFEKDNKKQTKQYDFLKMPLPELNEENSWQPVIEIQYKTKTFEEQTLVKNIENIRLEMNYK